MQDYILIFVPEANIHWYLSQMHVALALAVI